MPPTIRSATRALEQLNARIVKCELCPRLTEYRRLVAEQKRRAYLDQEYWGRPVPSFGDPLARVLILGLAPGPHGSNRTGRPFTGDGSGNFLYPVLYKTGFASQPNAVGRNDGMRLPGKQHPPRGARPSAGKKATSGRACQLRPLSRRRDRRAARPARNRVPGKSCFRWSRPAPVAYRTAHASRRDALRPWRGVRAAQRTDAARQLSPIAAKHEYRQADGSNVPRNFSASPPDRRPQLDTLSERSGHWSERRGSNPQPTAWEAA